MTQKLKLAAEFFPKIDDGTKRGTIRTGKRDISPGGLILECASDPDVVRMVQVERVTYTTTARLTSADAALDGYADVTELFRALRQFYPSLAGADPVTVVEFLK